MQELINFSLHPGDIGRFNNDWDAVAAYVQAHGVAGIELLIGHTPPPDTRAPPSLVGGVHLPYWISWLATWQGHAPALPTADAWLFERLYGGQCAADLVNQLRQDWQHAALLRPAYMVFHVCHIEIAHTFTYTYPYTSAEVCAATAALLNATAATFPDGEPPVRLWLENLWWPGLTFTDPAHVVALAEALHFTNWGFVLDTGHLMNTNPALTTQAQGIDYILAMLAQLPADLRDRIEGIHLNASLSGAYQQQAVVRGRPNGFDHMPLAEQYRLAREHVAQLDLHQPFTSPRCAEIIAAVQPQVVTHEFIGTHPDAFVPKLMTQRAALYSTQEEMLQ